MLFADGALGLVLLALWIFCIIDVITTDESQMRNLPKLAWLFIVLLFLDIGSIVWLVAGRVWQSGPQSQVSRRVSGAYPEYDRPGRAVPANPDHDEQFLRGVRERADEQRRRYQVQRKAELEAEQARLRKKPDEQ